MIKDPTNLLIPVLVMILPLIAVLIWVCKKYFIPALSEKIALELNKDTLQYFISNKTIYWNDVESIDKNTGGRNGWIIIFSMLDRSRNIKIPTMFIAGNDENIFNTVCEYAQAARPEIFIV